MIDRTLMNGFFSSQNINEFHVKSTTNRKKSAVFFVSIFIIQLLSSCPLFSTYFSVFQVDYPPYYSPRLYCLSVLFSSSVLRLLRSLSHLSSLFFAIFLFSSSSTEFFFFFKLFIYLNTICTETHHSNITLLKKILSQLYIITSTLYLLNCSFISSQLFLSTFFWGGHPPGPFSLCGFKSTTCVDLNKHIKQNQQIVENPTVQ